MLPDASRHHPVRRRDAAQVAVSYRNSLRRPPPILRHISRAPHGWPSAGTAGNRRGITGITAGDGHAPAGYNNATEGNLTARPQAPSSRLGGTRSPRATGGD